MRASARGRAGPRSLAAYLDRLEAADAEIRRTLSDLPTRRIATFHDAFGYFADAYGLEVVGGLPALPGQGAELALPPGLPPKDPGLRPVAPSPFVNNAG
jgi:hypothetical protein